MDYKKILKTRSKIINDYVFGKQTIKESVFLLKSLQNNFLRTYIEITLKRIKVLSEIKEIYEDIINNIFEKKNNISISYKIFEEEINKKTNEEIVDFIQKKYSYYESIELKKGSVLQGPQKHDIKVLFLEQDSRFYCSQGEQRALILAFKLAQIIYHNKIHKEYPVLILDDVFSELDKEKKFFLVKFLEKINSQVFITSCDKEIIKYFSKESIEENVKIYIVEKGTLIHEN